MGTVERFRYFCVSRQTGQRESMLLQPAVQRRGFSAERSCARTKMTVYCSKLSSIFVFEKLAKGGKSACFKTGHVWISHLLGHL